MAKPSIRRELKPLSSEGGAFRQWLSSPWTRWVGLRYLRSKKNSRFLSFITLISMLGVALGVSAMIVVLSVMDGFESELKKRLMSSDLHVLITPKESVLGWDRGIVPESTLSPVWIAGFRKEYEEVTDFWPILSTEAILRTGKKVAGVQVKGITAERLEKLKQQVKESVDPEFLASPASRAQASLPGLWLGQELAYELGVLPGDPVSLVSPIETEGPFSAVPRMKRFVVHGIYHSGTPEQELQNVFATMGSVRSFLRRSSGVSQWEISVSNFDRARRVGDHLKKAQPELQVKDWTELNGQLFASLKLERFAMFVSLTFIIIVASFNIVTTLTLMVLQKRREISILKAMGARPGQIGAIFLAEGMYIGGVGVGGGVVLAWVLCMLLKRYEFIQLPDIYYDRTLPVTFDWAYYVGVPVVAMAIVLVACLYPSRRASRLNAIDGIRLG